MIPKLACLLTLIYLFCTCYASDDCTKIDVLVTGNVENEGFHRYLKWLIEFTVNDMHLLQSSGCRMALRQDIPAGLFVNPDQIADLIRVDKILAVIPDKIDTESPLHLSEGHVAFLYNNGTLTEKVAFELPIHLRYQRAQITGGYGKVELPSSSVLVKCKSNIKFCDQKQKVDAPCSYSNKNNCRWTNISYQDITNDIELLVPIGDLDHYPLVSIVTLLVACAGCIYILSVLSTTVL